MGSLAGEAPDSLAIVIPTYNERPNVEPLLREFATLNNKWAHSFHIILVDDSSPDGTGQAALRLGEQLGLSVTVLSRPPPRSLGSAIATGIAHTDATVVCVMDADLSHPPSLLPAMLERLDGFDGVVASRYISGGHIAEWPAHRRVISYIATALARSVIKGQCTDPLSGYFVLRKPAIQSVRITGLGNKPLLEVLSQASLAVQEIPYEFRNRQNGRSKLSLGGILSFARLLAVSTARLRANGRDIQTQIDGKISEFRDS